MYQNEHTLHSSTFNRLLLVCAVSLVLTVSFAALLASVSPHSFHYLLWVFLQEFLNQVFSFGFWFCSRNYQTSCGSPHWSVLTFASCNPLLLGVVQRQQYWLNGECEDEWWMIASPEVTLASSSLPFSSLYFSLRLLFPLLHFSSIPRLNTGLYFLLWLFWNW